MEKTFEYKFHYALSGLERIAFCAQIGFYCTIFNTSKVVITQITCVSCKIAKLLSVFSSCQNAIYPYFAIVHKNLKMYFISHIFSGSSQACKFYR